MVRLCLLPAAFIVAPAVALAQIVAGTDTRGGAVSGGRAIHVTTLADDGPGSLREAVGENGPRVIVFDVSGAIRLNRDLKISKPNITIAGQTAPDPGITLTGASLRVRSHDVVIQHIALRPGPAVTPQENGNRDGMTIGGGKEPAEDIRVENVSVSWGIDENIGITGTKTRNIILRNSLIAEALRNAGHPKGAHSMGLLVNEGAQSVAVLNNLFVSNMYRNPALARGISALVAGNIIANPGRGAVHFYAEKRNGPLRASIIGNLVLPGADTASHLTAVRIPSGMTQEAKIYAADNSAPAGALRNDSDIELEKKSPIALSGESKASKAWTLRYTGSRPGRRDNIDRRIVAGAWTNAARILENLSGQDVDLPSRAEAVKIPPDPFQPLSANAPLRIEAWLCLRHLEVGGPATEQCPLEQAVYENALSSTAKKRS